MTPQGLTLADRAAAGHSAGWQKSRRRMNRGWLEVRDGFTIAATGLPAPSFNGATVYSAADRAELTEAMGRVAAGGAPFCLQARPDTAEAAARLATKLGMERGPDLSLMATTEPPAAVDISGLRLRRLAPDEGAIQAALTAEAFGTPLALMRKLATPEMLGGRGAHPFAGDWGGVTVATATADVNDATAGIYDVATGEAHRGRGFGTAVTAAAVRAGFEDGGQLAFLLATAMGAGVYERLGFRELEQWSVWVAYPAA